jgi:hypothetical protein
VNTLRFLAVSSLFVSAALSAQVIPPAVRSAEAAVDAEKIRAHVKYLADDSLEGRGPGTRGGEMAADYPQATTARTCSRSISLARRPWATGRTSRWFPTSPRAAA